MTSLTVKSLFYTVFCIVCISTVSADAKDDIKDCKANVRQVFRKSNTPFENFDMAMTAFSEKTFIEIQKISLEGYYEVHNVTIEGNEHSEIYAKIQSFGQWLKDIASTSRNNPRRSLAAQKEDLLGYFQILVDDLYLISRNISMITMTPLNFCAQRRNGELIYSNESLCKEALCSMLNLHDDNPEVKHRKFIEMSGFKAFHHCYLNHSYLDFISNTWFEPCSHSDAYKKIVIKEYFKHMIKVSMTIGTFYDTIGFEIFPSIDDYCRQKVQRRIIEENRNA